MPYGLPKQLDTPANNSKLKRCVSSLQAKDHDKTSAIRIYKDSIANKKKRKS